MYGKFIITWPSYGRQSEPESRILHQALHFGDESFQEITCTGTDEENRKNKHKKTNTDQAYSTATGTCMGRIIGKDSAAK